MAKNLVKAPITFEHMADRSESFHTLYISV